jgi:predicted small metal-binding protein
MGRMFVDCREMPGDKKCSVAIAADNETELLDAVVQHAVAVHGAKDTPQLRNDLKKAFHQGTPPMQVHRAA